MSEMFEPSPEQFGVFWDFLMQPDVTDVDYNGSALWITDLKKGKYRAKEAEEKVTENFLDAFTHNIANCVDAQFNNANKVLEADKNFVSVSFMILWRQPGQASVSADLRVWCVIRLTGC